MEWWALLLVLILAVIVLLVDCFYFANLRAIQPGTLPFPGTITALLIANLVALAALVLAGLYWLYILWEGGTGPGWASSPSVAGVATPAGELVKVSPTPLGSGGTIQPFGSSATGSLPLPAEGSYSNQALLSSLLPTASHSSWTVSPAGDYHATTIPGISVGAPTNRPLTGPTTLSPPGGRFDCCPPSTNSDLRLTGVNYGPAPIPPSGAVYIPRG
jgi:hypothetical protein